MKPYLIVFVLVVSCLTLSSQTLEVIVPSFDDMYSQYVQSLEKGETNIDYQEFRFSFIESEQFIVATRKSGELDSLEKTMRAELEKKNYNDLVRITKQMLSIDYTNMMAHKILRQTYAILEDTINAKKYKTIQFGLLNSIVKNGDGKTCDTAWQVIQLSEEYFILEMLHANVQKIEGEGLCDKITAKVDKKKKVYYFDAYYIFQGYKKLEPDIEKKE